MTADSTTTRLLAAAALTFAAATLASAQTVIVRNAPANARVELFLNSDSVATATADSTGTATLTLDVLARLQRSETGVHVSLDACGQQRRILLVETGEQPPAQGSCTRGTVRDLFSIQRITTLVVDVTGENPVVWIRQGPAPPQWMGNVTAEQGRNWAQPPLGAMVSAGLGGATFANLVNNACGDASSCTGQNVSVDYMAGATFWFNRFLAADVGYVRPASLKVSGSGTNVTFNSGLDARVITVAGKVGAQAGPVRLYGIGGANRLFATSTTVQTVTDTTVGLETFGMKAEGWGWLAGGGVEMYPLRRIGVFIEGTVLQLHGTAVDNAQGSISDRVIYGTLGIRLSLGKMPK